MGVGYGGVYELKAGFNECERPKDNENPQNRLLSRPPYVEYGI